MAYYKKIYEESDFGNNPYRYGDKVKVRGWDEIFTVGNDYGEIERWGSGYNPVENYIVTTTGRVFNIDQIEGKIPEAIDSKL